MTTLTKLPRLLLSLVIALLALILGWNLLVHAAGPGDLDPSFGEDGIVITPVENGSSNGRSVALQSDGKIVVAGFASSGGSGYYDIAVARYTITGSLDTTFDNDGIVTTPIGNSYDHGEAVAIQPDGKIVVAGDSDHYGDLDFVVARYTITGSLDSDFNGTGIVTTPISSEDEWGQSVALQPDGKIVVAGSQSNNGKYNVALVRYTITGSLDSTFNQTGIVTTPIGSGYCHHGVAIQADGKIVVVGDSDNSGGNSDFAVVRYTITGSLDSTFNDTGIVTTPISNGNDYGRAVAIQNDDKIVVAGPSDQNGFYSNVAVVRYTITGTLDTTFNKTGIVTSPISSGNDLAIQPDGKIVVAGSNREINQWDFSMVRYNSDGTLDTTVKNTCMITTDLGGIDLGISTAIQPDHKIVVVGSSDRQGNYDFALVRYLDDYSNSLYLPVILK